MGEGTPVYDEGTLFKLDTLDMLGWGDPRATAARALQVQGHHQVCRVDPQVITMATFRV